jgi:hypothetical protein
MGCGFDWDRGILVLATLALFLVEQGVLNDHLTTEKLPNFRLDQIVSSLCALAASGRPSVSHTEDD